MIVTLYDLWVSIKDKTGDELTAYLKSIKINVIPLDEHHCHVCGIDLREQNERFKIGDDSHYCREHYYTVGLSKQFNKLTFEVK